MRNELPGDPSLAPGVQARDLDPIPMCGDCGKPLTLEEEEYCAARDMPPRCGWHVHNEDDPRNDR